MWLSDFCAAVLRTENALWKLSFFVMSLITEELVVTGMNHLVHHGSGVEPQLHGRLIADPQSSIQVKRRIRDATCAALNDGFRAAHNRIPARARPDNPLGREHFLVHRLNRHLADNIVCLPLITAVDDAAAAVEGP
jgi:hypothetical protein